MFALLMAYFLGFRHGYDLDHISVIDAMTRAVPLGTRLARCVGLLFSFGHGLVVTIVSIVLGAGVAQSNIPNWLDGFGQWVSIIMLFLFGNITIYSLIRANKKQDTYLTWKSYFIRKFFNKRPHPFLIICVGALFAISFDTFSQVALFTLSSSMLSSRFFSCMLGFMFMLGMMTSDGINGFFVSILLQRANQFSQWLSYGMGWLIALFSYIIGLINLAKLVF